MTWLKGSPERKGRRGAGVAIALLGLLAGGCDPSPSRWPTDAEQAGAAGDAKAMFARIGLPFPPSARIEYLAETSGIDDALWLRLVVTKAHWAMIEADVARRIGQPLILREDDNGNLTDMDGWTNGATRGLKSASSWWVEGKSAINIGMAPIDGGHVRLFLFWHEV